MVRKSDHTLRLMDLSRKDIDRVGVKAANLGELMSLGLPVPDGFVVTTGAFDEFLATNSLSADSSPEEVIETPLPSGVTEALLSVVAYLGNVALAVRSSGVAEDLAGASFAGQYETVLDVRGVDALIAAVRRCWASAFSQRVKKYRTTRGQNGIPGMAVLVQLLVPADAAGVAFTANPVTGDQDEVVVSAVRGLGERLVSGQTSPDEWVVKGNEAICQRAPENAIDAVQAEAIAGLARKIEAHFKTPQDIEWAMAGGKLYLLQARPITALPRRPELNVPGKGFWMKDHTHFPSPVTPFGESIYLPALENGMRTMCQEFGLPLEGIENRAIGGEVYTHVVPLGGKEGPAPPPWIIFLVTRLLPPFRRCRRIAQEAFRSKLPERVTKRWYSEWREQFKQEGRDLLNQKLAKLNDSALIEHLDRVIDFMNRGQIVHMRLRVPYVFALYEFTAACKELLGWDDAKSMSLLSGTSNFSSKPGVRLTALAAIIGKSLAVREIITGSRPDILLQLRQTAPDIARAFEAYLNEYGHRPINYEPGSPTLAERPEFLAKLLRDRATVSRSDTGPALAISRKEAIENARSELAKRSNTDLQRFERLLSAAELTYPVREDDIFYTDNVPCALARYAAIEIGRRLVARGILANAGDAVYLKDTELRDAVRGKAGDPQALVDRRKAERAWVVAHPGPLSYGKESAPPDPRVLPEPLRIMTEAQVWYMGLEFGKHGDVAAEDQIIGASGASGHYTGTVRIVRGESEFARLGPGDVLVCPITTPAMPRIACGTARG